jgi:hypothetical protein
VCGTGTVCQLGTCQACSAVTGDNIQDCSGSCTNVDKDVNNCGACGTSCGAKDSCQAGVCTTATVAASGQDAPEGIATDAMNVYWTNAGTAANNYTDGTVMKLALNGTTPTAIAMGQALPFGIVSDGTNVYFTDTGTAANNYGDGKVVKVNIAAGTVTTLATSQPAPGFIAVSGTTLYWTNQGVTDNTGSVMSLPTAGATSPTPVASDLATPLDLVVYDNEVYWANAGTSANSYADGSIAMAAITGGTVTTIAKAQGEPFGLVLGEDGTTLVVIWTDAVTGTVEYADASASATVIELAHDQSSPTSITLGADGFYWTDQGSGTIATDPYPGATPGVLASSQSTPDAIALDGDGNVWWANLGTAANNYTDGSIVKSAQ